MGDALDVLRRLPDQSLTMVYLLHPDPWPKARHAKRRMINDGPLDLIAAKLKPGGEFRVATDDPAYLNWTLMIMQRHTDQFEWLVKDPAEWLATRRAGPRRATPPRRAVRAARLTSSVTGVNRWAANQPTFVLSEVEGRRHDRCARRPSTTRFALRSGRTSLLFCTCDA